MLNIIFLLSIFIIFILVCRKNISSRSSELSSNFEEGKELLQSIFFDLSDIQREIFTNSLDSKELSFLEFALNNQKSMYQNPWSSQQNIILLQSLLQKINRFKNTDRA